MKLNEDVWLNREKLWDAKKDKAYNAHGAFVIDTSYLKNM